MKKFIVVKIEALKTNLNVIIGYTFEELNELLLSNDCKKVEDKWKNSLGLAFTNEDDKGTPYHAIWIKDFKPDLEGIGIIVHELHHIITHINKYKGFKDFELSAYMQEYFFKEIIKELKYNASTKKDKKCKTSKRNSRKK